MQSVAISGSDTIILNDRSIIDLADGDCGKLEFGGVISKQKNGKNGNVIFSKDETGNAGKLTLRLIRGSADDKNMNSILALQQSNFASFVLFKGRFVKKVGDGNGVLTNDTYILSQGTIEKIPGAGTNSEGSTDQSIVIWELIFANVNRALT